MTREDINLDTTYEACPNCGHMVPSCNMALHQVRCNADANTTRDLNREMSRSPPLHHRPNHGNGSDSVRTSAIEEVPILPSSPPAVGTTTREMLGSLGWQSNSVIDLASPSPSTASRTISTFIPTTSPPSTSITAQSTNNNNDDDDGPSRQRRTAIASDVETRYRNAAATYATVPPSSSSREVVNLTNDYDEDESEDETYYEQRQEYDRTTDTNRLPNNRKRNRNRNRNTNTNNGTTSTELSDTTEDNSSQIEEQWECPRCTLLNSIHAPRCDACNYDNPAMTLQREEDFPTRYIPINSTSSSSSSTLERTVRPPDSVIRERLISASVGRRQVRAGDVRDHPFFTRRYTFSNRGGYHDHHHEDRHAATNNDNNNNNTTDEVEDDGILNSENMMAVGSSALLGSALGAAASYVTDRNVTNGAIEGAFAGAVGGALSRATVSRLNSSSGDVSRGEGSRNSRAAAAMDAFNDGNDTERTSSFSDRPRWTQYRGGYRSRPITNLEYLLLRSRPLQDLQGVGTIGDSGGINGNVDNMTYERLIELFGHGDDNLGLSQSTIRSLPSTTIKDVKSELPADHRQCSICLEDFVNGDKRRMLPCLHGFHEDCIDKWLASNGCCPVCKHKVTE